MITRVRLKNWKTHLNSELEFSKGTNVIVGIVGSGKTSVMNAICFGLFGTFPDLQTKKVKLQDVIMKKPFEQSEAEVEVEFMVDDTSYMVKRVIDKRKGTSYSEFRENGKLLEAQSAQRVTELVEKRLKISYDLFSKAIYSEQNALDYFLVLARGQRMKKIDKLLMIDKFEKARAFTVTLTNRINDRIDEKRRLLQQVDLGLLGRNIDELKSEAKRLEASKSEMQKLLGEVTAKKFKVEEELKGLKKLVDQLEKAKNEERAVDAALAETKRAMESFGKELTRLNLASVERELRRKSKELKELESALDERKKEYIKVRDRLAKTTAEIEMLREGKLKELTEKIGEMEELVKEAREFKTKLRDVEKLVSSKEKLLRKLAAKSEVVESRIAELKEMIKKLRSIKGTCPVCDSRLTQSKKRGLLKQKKKLIKQLELELRLTKKKKAKEESSLAELKEKYERMKEIKTELKNYEKLRKELEVNESVLAVWIENQQRFTKRLEQLEKEMEDLGKKRETVVREKQMKELTYQRLRDLSTAKERLEELLKTKSRIVELVSHLESKVKLEDLERMETKLKELIGTEKELGAKVSSLSELIKEKQKRLEEMGKNLDMLLKAKKEMEKLQNLVLDLKVFERALKVTQEELRTEFVAAVNYYMTQIWPTLYPYEDFIGLRLGIEEGDYVLQLQERSGKWVSVERVASGGERSLAALALRIAFSLALAPQLKVLILDEPTHNLDQRSTEELATTLRERMNEFMEQVFLITHDEKLEDAVTGSAYRLERDKSIDGATKIVRIV